MEAIKIIVDVKFFEGSYSAQIDILPGCVAAASSLAELRKLMDEAVPFHLEGMKGQNEKIPVEFSGEYELIYKIDVQSLLHHYDGIFTKAALSRITGINQRQLWHYEAGVRKPRPAQKKRIKEGIHKLGQELLSVELL